MKVKTNSIKQEAQITIKYTEMIYLIGALQNWNTQSLPHLQMTHITELLTKILKAKITIEKNATPKH